MNKRKNAYLLTLAFFLSFFVKGTTILHTSLCQAQSAHLKFSDINIHQEQSQSRVYAVCEDTLGFIWLGTSEGLCRYDGYEIKYFKHNPQDSMSLSSNEITSLFVDSFNQLWIGTENRGLNLFNWETNTFFRYQFDPNNRNSIGNNSITCIFEDIDRRLWIGTQNGLSELCIDPNHCASNPKITRHLPNPRNSNALHASSIRAIAQGHSKDLYIGTRDGGIEVFMIKENGLGTRQLQKTHAINTSINSPAKISTNKIETLHVDAQGLIWIGTNGKGIDLLNPKDWSVINYKLETDPEEHGASKVNSFHMDHKNNLWIGTDGGGLYILNLHTKKLSKYRRSLYDPNSIAHDVILDIFIDKAGIIWIASLNGINKFSWLNNQFALYRNEPDNPNSLSHNETRAFLSEQEEGQDILWIGTDGGGLNRFDRKKNEFKHYKKGKGKGKINDNVVLSILKDSQERYWLGSYTGGLMFFKPSAKASSQLEFGAITMDNSEPYAPNVNFIRSVTQSSNGDLFLATSGGGLNILSKKTGKISHYVNNPFEPNSISSNILMFCHEDRTGQIWIGTWGGGLVRYNSRNNSFREYLPEPNRNSISNDKVNCLLENADGSFWLGTNNGLNFFDPKKDSFEIYTTEQGLCNNKVYGILSDEKGHLWISTNNGLSRFNLAEKKFTNFYDKHGLQHNGFYLGAYHKCPNGEMIFGGGNGFNIFHPDSIKISNTLPRVLFTKLKVWNATVGINDVINGQKILSKDLPLIKKLNLSHKNNTFSISFSAMHFNAPQYNKYKCRLEGLDDSWVDLGRENHITYTNLRPGNYVLKVKACNNDGVWNHNPSSIHIRISPPIWKTKIAFFSYTMFGLALIGLVMKLRTYKLKKQKEHLEKIVRRRTSELTETNTLLEEKQEEIIAQNEELEQKQEEISLQKQELENHRNHLEELVKARTEELEKAKERAELSENVKTNFLANMSHEIRTPMNAIVGFASMMEEDELSEEERKEYLYIIKKNSDDLLLLINDVLDLTQIESGSLYIKKETFFLESILEEIYATYGHRAQVSGLELRRQYDTTRASEVFSDSGRIKQILKNLIENSLKYTSSGYIEIKLDQEPSHKLNNLVSNPHQQYYTISVEDSGIGISDEIKDEIFERFTKIDAGNLTEQHGSGLGLSISQKLVQLLDGDIWVESEKTKYTRFSFTIPALKASSSLSGTKPRSKFQIQKNWHGKTLLVAEDEWTNYHLVKTIIDKTNAEVVWAKNGEEALSLLQEKRIDLGIIDIRMPKMNGFEFMTHFLKMNLDYPKPPMVAFTAFTLHYSEKNFLESGFSSYIFKPFKPLELIQLIEECFSGANDQGSH